MTSSDFKWRQAAQAVDGMRIFRVKVGGYWTDEHWLVTVALKILGNVQIPWDLSSICWDGF